MQNKKHIIVIGISGAVIILGAIISGQLFITNTNQRHASCDGTLVALKAISQTNVAGLRVVAPIPPGIDEKLFKSFKLQQAQTILANNKRLAVIKDVNVEIVNLKRSKFCE